MSRPNPKVVVLPTTQTRLYGRAEPYIVKWKFDGTVMSEAQLTMGRAMTSRWLMGRPSLLPPGVDAQATGAEMSTEMKSPPGSVGHFVVSCGELRRGCDHVRSTGGNGYHMRSSAQETSCGSGGTQSNCNAAHGGASVWGTGVGSGWDWSELIRPGDTGLLI